MDAIQADCDANPQDAKDTCSDTDEGTPPPPDQLPFLTGRGGKQGSFLRVASNPDIDSVPPPLGEVINDGFRLPPSKDISPRSHCWPPITFDYKSNREAICGLVDSCSEFHKAVGGANHQDNKDTCSDDDEGSIPPLCIPRGDESDGEGDDEDSESTDSHTPNNLIAGEVYKFVLTEVFKNHHRQPIFERNFFLRRSIEYDAGVVHTNRQHRVLLRDPQEPVIKINTFDYINNKTGEAKRTAADIEKEILSDPELSDLPALV